MLAEKAVVQQTVQIVGHPTVARHVRVAQHEVHVVDRVDAAEQRAQKTAATWVGTAWSPSRGRMISQAIWSGSSVSSVLQPAVGISPQAAQRVAQRRRG